MAQRVSPGQQPLIANRQRMKKRKGKRTTLTARAWLMAGASGNPEYGCEIVFLSLGNIVQLDQKCGHLGAILAG